jgi:hypothetical protein
MHRPTFWFNFSGSDGRLPLEMLDSGFRPEDGKSDIRMFYETDVMTF